MTAPITITQYVTAVVGSAQARGVTDPDAIASLKRDAADYWQSYINTASGRPPGNIVDDRSH
jgi:hypothetical protein